MRRPSRSRIERSAQAGLSSGRAARVGLAFVALWSACAASAQPDPETASAGDGGVPAQAQAGSNPAPPLPAPEPGTPSGPLAPFEGPTGLLSGLMDPFDYDPRGRRDPFSPPTADKPIGPGGVHGPLLPLQKVPLNQIYLTGVIWDVKRPRAIVEAGRTSHVVGLNAKLGQKNGYIAAIREGEIVVIETEEQNGKLSSTSTIVKISNGAGQPNGTGPANQ